MTYDQWHAHYICPMVKEDAEDTEENEELVECYIFESNGLVMVNAVGTLDYRERCYTEDRFLFYLNAGYIRKKI